MGLGVRKGCVTWKDRKGRNDEKEGLIVEIREDTRKMAENEEREGLRRPIIGWCFNAWTGDRRRRKFWDMRGRKSKDKILNK